MESREELESKPRFFTLLVSLLFTPQSLMTFPTWIQQHGGVAVIMPYTASVLILAIPMVFLELSLGQFMQRSGTRMWGVAPLFKGLGITAMFTSILRSSLNVVVASWAGYYIYLTLTNQLPSCKLPLPASELQHPSNWSTAAPGLMIQSTYVTDDVFNKTFNTSFTSTAKPRGIHTESFPLLEYKDLTVLQTLVNKNGSSYFVRSPLNVSSCNEAFGNVWRNEILQLTPSITPPGQSVLHVFIGSIIIIILSSLVVILGVGIMSRILAVLTPMSLVMATILLVQACVRDGHGVTKGLSYLWHPDFELIIHPDLWLSCCHQVLLNHSLSVGVLPSMASYLRWNNKSFRDTLVMCVLVALINVLTSLLVFGIMGSVASVGSPNTLTAITLALSLLPNSSIWIVLFLLLLILVIITTNLMYWESAVLTFTDASSKLTKWRMMIVIGVALLVFLITIPMSLQSGIYSFRLLDYVAFGPFLVGVVCFLECVIMAFIYGGHKFYDNLETMTLHEPHWWMRFCWAWLCPYVILATVCYEGYVLYHEPMSLGVSEPYHHLANMLVLMLVCMLLLPLPLTAVWILCSGPAGCVRFLFIAKLIFDFISIFIARKLSGPYIHDYSRFRFLSGGDWKGNGSSSLPCSVGGHCMEDGAKDKDNT